LNVKKIVIGLLIINLMEFCIGLIMWLWQGKAIITRVSIYAFLSMVLMLFGCLITIIGLYFAVTYKNENLTDSIRDLEELNTRLRAQRHDYLNHFQVIYGLMELGEYEEAKQYINPVFKDIMKVSKALKTAQPAVNALLQSKIEAAEQKQIDLFLEIRSDLRDLPIEAWNLCKVLANIIDNGMNALAGIEKEKNLYVVIGENVDSYTFEISNNGPEIPKNHLEDIFKQGFSTNKEEEHGMGLYIVARIVKEAGGTVSVTSDLAKTSFHIQLPKRKTM
jgi:sensor histidine kinase regulating citrate/malate metabolism